MGDVGEKGERVKWVKWVKRVYRFRSVIWINNEVDMELTNLLKVIYSSIKIK